MTSREYDIQEKWAVVAQYNLHVDPTRNKLPDGALQKITKVMGVPKRTILNFVNDYKHQIKGGTIFPDLRSHKKGKVGAKSKRTREVERALKNANRITSSAAPYRVLAENTGLPLASVYRYCMDMGIEKHATWSKPYLTLHQRMCRLRFVLSLVERRGYQISSRFLAFTGMECEVHVDEAWFYLQKDKGFVRLFPGDPMPNPVFLKHKKHIPKIMILTAVAQPRQTPNGQKFDGKIGIWRVWEERICQRTTLYYHDKDEVYSHDCNMDADLYRQFMTNEVALGDPFDGVFGKIKDKMPNARNINVVVRQDGATPHVGKGNLEYFNARGQLNGFNIVVVTQPSQSPDMNINDLGFFRSLKCRVAHAWTRDEHKCLDAMMEKVESEWENYDYGTTERIWAHQLAWIVIVKF